MEGFTVVDSWPFNFQRDARLVIESLTRTVRSRLKKIIRQLFRLFDL